MWKCVAGTSMLREARVVVTLVSLSCAAMFALANEPVFFYPDQENAGLEHAYPPSDAVLNSLLRTKEAKSAEDRVKNRDHEELRRLFEAVNVHLSDPGAESDQVVVGKFPMAGADCDWFWLVRVVSGRAEVILFANGSSLELLGKQTNGYRDIRTVWSSAAGYTLTDIYCYNGARYTRVHEFTKAERRTP